VPRRQGTAYSSLVLELTIRTKEETDVTNKEETSTWILCMIKKWIVNFFYIVM
jgi:hypothetical protein